MTMDKRLVLALAFLLAACAAGEKTEERAVRSDEEYITGSRIPGKGGRVRTMSKEELERMRAAQPQPVPEGLTPP
jgi:hypothetical protein